MAINIVVPETASGKFLSTKDLIISNLVEEWPLTAKQLFNRIIRQSDSNVTYQAVHKMLSQMLKEEILTRQGKGYQLSKNWIERIKKFSDNLNAIYSDKKRIPVNCSFDKPVFLSFDNFSELARFIIYDFHGALSNPPRKPALCLWAHHWPIIGLSDKEYTFCARLFKCGNYYAVTRGDTPLDRLFGGILEKINKKTEFGVNLSAQHDTFVHDDIICQVFFPPELTEQLDKLYNSVEKIDIESLNDIFKDLLSKETSISLVIFKNPDLAEKLREEALAIFEKEKK